MIGYAFRVCLQGMNPHLKMLPPTSNTTPTCFSNRKLSAQFGNLVYLHLKVTNRILANFKNSHNALKEIYCVFWKATRIMMHKTCTVKNGKLIWKRIINEICSWKDVSPHRGKSTPQLPWTFSSPCESPQHPTFLTPWKMVHSPKYICSKSNYSFVCTYVFFFRWPSLCATSYLPMKTVKDLCVSLPMSAVILSFCLPLLVQSLILTEKPNCIKVNHVVSMINTPRILVKLFQMIWCYVTRFMVCQPVWLFLWIFKKISISHHNGIMSHTPKERPGVPVITGG